MKKDKAQGKVYKILAEN